MSSPFSPLKLLSHSSRQTLHRCPREFELSRISLTEDRDESDYDVHLTFGKCLGLGVQQYLLTNSRDASVFAMEQAWPGVVDFEEGRQKRKSFYHLIEAIDLFMELRHTRYANFSLVSFSGKPAIELSFRISLGNGFFYRAFVDAVMYNTVQNKLAVFEVKHTGFANIHPAMYQNSGQAVSYQACIEVLIKQLDIPGLTADFDVHYPVYQVTKSHWEPYAFSKKLVAKRRWLYDILADMDNIESCVKQNHFPMYGESCYSFFRVCKFFELCTLSNSSLPLASTEDLEKKEAAAVYDFDLTLDDVLAALGDK